MNDKAKLKNIVDRIEYINEEIEQIRKRNELFSSEKYFLQQAITSLVDAQESINTAIK